MTRKQRGGLSLLLVFCILLTLLPGGVFAAPQAGPEPALEAFTQTLEPALALEGFDEGWDADPNALIEIGVQFVTPPSVALRLMHEAEPQRARMSLSADDFEAQAQAAHDVFWAQAAPLTRARTTQIEILSEHNLLFNGVFLRVPIHMVEQIAALPEVAVITPNEVYEPEPVIPVPESTSGIAPTSGDPFMRGTRELFDLDYIHNHLLLPGRDTPGITGAQRPCTHRDPCGGCGEHMRPVRVGILDTGVYHNHPRFVPYHNPETGRIRGWCFMNGNDNPAEEGSDHGTVVTGPVIAIAPGVELWHFRAIGTSHNIQVVEMAHREGIDVLNRTSLVGGLGLVGNLAVLDGMIIVNSAGNSGQTFGGYFTVSAGLDSLVISAAAGQGGSDEVATNAGMGLPCFPPAVRRRDSLT